MKPMQFTSVAGGVQRRLDENIKKRKISRFSVMDNLRNIEDSKEDVPICKPVLSKAEFRRQQLEKWKEEKAQKKKMEQAQSKKPFVTGVPHVSLRYVPPPPLSTKPMPSVSGRVTRSVSSKNKIQFETKPIKDENTNSFAPKNAKFRAPKLNNLTTAPTFVPWIKNSKQKTEECLNNYNPLIIEESTKRKVKNKHGSKPIIQTATNVRVTRSNKNKTEDITATSKIVSVNKGVAIEKSITTSKTAKNLPTSNNFPKNIIDKTVAINKDMGKGKRCVAYQPVATSSESSSNIELDDGNHLVLPMRKSLSRKCNPKNNNVISIQTVDKSLIPKSESHLEEKLRSPKSPNYIITPDKNDITYPVDSPLVTMSRGKNNARKEMKMKLDEGLDIEEAIKVDSAEFFRQKLNFETQLMTEMCAVWDKILEEILLPDNVQELVLGAVGQARLLMSKKMVQFAGLVTRAAASPSAERPVTIADLEGFWDIIYMQIEDINARFKKLEELRTRNWMEETVDVTKRVTNKVVKKQTKAKPNTTGPSKLREMIAAARKANRMQKDNHVKEEVEQKTFEAGFFSVCSPVKSPVEKLRYTPSNQKKLLKSVLSNEVKKSASKNTAYAMLRASLLIKDLGVEGVMPLPVTPVPLPLINLSATPGRSILKSNKKADNSIKKIVYFDESTLNCEDIESVYETANGKEVESESDEAIVPSVTEVNTDITIPSMDMECGDNKENSKVVTKKRISRQNAIDQPSPVLTRSRRKSLNASKVEDENVQSVRSSRRKSSRTGSDGKEDKKPTKVSSHRKKVLKELMENEDDDEKSITPRRSVRRKATNLERYTNDVN